MEAVHLPWGLGNLGAGIWGPGLDQLPWERGSRGSPAKVWWARGGCFPGEWCFMREAAP